MKVMCENWFKLVEAFKSYRGNQKKKKITDAAQTSILTEFSCRADKKKIKTDIVVLASSNPKTH